MCNQPDAEQGSAERARPQDSRDWLSFNLRWIALAFSSSLVVGLFFLRPSMRQIYQDFEIDLSQMTLWVLDPLAPACLAILPVAVLAKEFLPIAQSAKRLMNSLAICLSLLLGIVAALALFQPLVVLISHLDG
jgi:hypothetical protein